MGVSGRVRWGHGRAEDLVDYESSVGWSEGWGDGKDGLLEAGKRELRIVDHFGLGMFSGEGWRRSRELIQCSFGSVWLGRGAGVKRIS